MEKLIYQMFILGTGEALEQALQKGLGGVIFFTKDIENAVQFKELIKRIKSKSIISPFLSIDQEGGRVERTEKIHERYLSAKYAYEKGIEFLKEQNTQIAKELKSYGLNLNFAPCADVNTNPLNPIIGERSFSNNPEIVSQCVNLISDIYRNNGIIPCIKHFPGHGDANKDSHLELPQISLSFDEMKNIHIKPFAEAIKKDIEMIMVAHLHCACFDKEILPASLSKNVINYLRNDLKFQNVIISDDMVMKGVQDYGSLEACIMGIKAGIDMFIFRDCTPQRIELIEQIIKAVKSDTELQKKVILANDRISKLKKQRLLSA